MYTRKVAVWGDGCFSFYEEVGKMGHFTKLGSFQGQAAAGVVVRGSSPQEVALEVKEVLEIARKYNLKATVV